MLCDRKLAKGMHFTVGQTVRSVITNETGRIVRIVKLPRLAYVVAVENKATGREIQALWWARELKELRERAGRLRKYREESSEG